MKKLIIKLSFSWTVIGGNWRKTNTPKQFYVNVYEIKTLSPIVTGGGEVIGTSVFYMAGLPGLRDDRTPDELQEYINRVVHTEK